MALILTNVNIRLQDPAVLITIEINLNNVELKFWPDKNLKENPINPRVPWISYK